MKVWEMVGAGGLQKEGKRNRVALASSPAARAPPESPGVSCPSQLGVTACRNGLSPRDPGLKALCWKGVGLPREPRSEPLARQPDCLSSWRFWPECLSWPQPPAPCVGFRVPLLSEQGWGRARHSLHTPARPYAALLSQEPVRGVGCST